MFERNTKLYITYKLIVFKFSKYNTFMASRVQGLDGSYQNNGLGVTKSGYCKYGTFVKCTCVHIIFLIHLTY